MGYRKIKVIHRRHAAGVTLADMEQLSISAASEPMPPADGAELEQWFGGQDGVASILNALKMFEQD
ncbi:MAG: hypothetical protein Q4D08_08740 [Clostridia bacterium]|nr:hypothetical protein [Clostridia bacterium]